MQSGEGGPSSEHMTLTVDALFRAGPCAPPALAQRLWLPAMCTAGLSRFSWPLLASPTVAVKAVLPKLSASSIHLSRSSSLARWNCTQCQTVLQWLVQLASSNNTDDTSCLPLSRGFLAPHSAVPTVEENFDTSTHSVEAVEENFDTSTHSVEAVEENFDSSTHSVEAVEEERAAPTHSIEAVKRDFNTSTHSVKAKAVKENCDT